MSSNIRQFDAKLRKRQEAVVPAISDRQRLVAIEGLRTAVRLSPVLTGQFKGSWRLSDAPNVRWDPVPDPSGDATVARGIRAVQNMRDFGIVYLVNPAPYGRDIEGGSSDQAPHGVLALTIKTLRRNRPKRPRRLG